MWYLPAYPSKCNQWNGISTNFASRMNIKKNRYIYNEGFLIQEDLLQVLIKRTWDLIYVCQTIYNIRLNIPFPIKNFKVFSIDVKSFLLLLILLVLNLQFQHPKIT